jgi:hypothetical protein
MQSSPPRVNPIALSKPVLKRKELELLRDLSRSFRVTKGKDFRLKDVDPADTTRVVVAAAVIEALAELDLNFPEVDEAKRQDQATARTELSSQTTSRKMDMHARHAQPRKIVFHNISRSTDR